MKESNKQFDDVTLHTEALKLAEEVLDINYLVTRQAVASILRRLVEELDKQGEPVAVIYQHPDHLRPAIKFTKPFSYKAMTAVNPDILLYTSPQTKPLSDEEIIAIRDSCYVQSGIDEWEFDDVVFARAIEERYGIK